MPWVAPALSIAGKLVSKAANQLLIGSGVHLDAFFGQRDCEIGGIGLQFAARILGERLDLRLRTVHDPALIFFSGSTNTLFFRLGFAFGLSAHFSHFRIEARQPGFNLAEPAVGVGAGALSLVERFADDAGARTEHGGDARLHQHIKDEREDRKVQRDEHPVSALQRDAGDTRERPNRRRFAKLSLAAVAFISSCFVGLPGLFVRDRAAGLIRFFLQLIGFARVLRGSRRNRLTVFTFRLSRRALLGRGVGQLRLCRRFLCKADESGSGKDDEQESASDHRAPPAGLGVAPTCFKIAWITSVASRSTSACKLLLASTRSASSAARVSRTRASAAARA